MPKPICILLLIITLASCTVKIQPTTPTDTTPPSTDNGDPEITDSIPLENPDTIDSLITPDLPRVTRWPQQFETWDGHFVIFTDSLSPQVAELTLLSRSEWKSILSANSSDSTQATDTATHYIEYTLTDWTIPTEAQARRMKSDLDPSDLNAHLKALSLDTMRTKSGSSNARYLCEEATKTFSLAENSNITSAGAKTKYRLRLLTTQRVARP